jgi:hypothetical protein
MRLRDPSLEQASCFRVLSEEKGAHPSPAKGEGRITTAEPA